MNINRNNYEAYFLDYHEKTLQPEQVAELMVFLEANPDLKEEFDSFETFSLVHDNALFENKKALKKKEYKATERINSFNYEEWMVADMEGDLLLNQISEIKDFLKINPSARLEYSLFKKTRLQPDNTPYDYKDSLKKGGLILLYRSQVIYAASIAALVLIFFGVYFGMIKNQPVNTNMARSVLDLELPAIKNNHINIPGYSIPVVNSRKTFVSQFNLNENNSNLISPLHAVKDVNKANSNSPDLFAANKLNGLPAQIKDRENHFSGRNIKSHILATNEKQRSFTGRFIAGITHRLFKSNSPENKSFLEYTINGYNIMADREVEVEKKYDLNGNVIAYNVKGDGISFSRKVNQ